MGSKPKVVVTRYRVDADGIALVRPGVILINTARGGPVDDEALQQTLRSGQVAAPGLGVFNDEPEFRPAYRALENTFLLHDIGSATRVTRDALGLRTVDDGHAIVAGREPGDRVA